MGLKRDETHVFDDKNLYLQLLSFNCWRFFCRLDDIQLDTFLRVEFDQLVDLLLLDDFLQ